MTHEDRASHVAGLGFDAAVWEIWPNLCSGAALCLVDSSIRSSPKLLSEWIIRERVTIAFIPTVHASSMMAIEWPTDTALRLLLTGGDVLRQAPPPGLPFQVVNNYGPAECTVVATSAVLDAGSPGTPCIGRAILGAKVYILDEAGRQVPPGATGEISIGGEGVGRGYRNLHDETSRRFVSDPFAGVPGARMYRTGDRGSVGRDGEIEFRGRIDRQVKIRGQRIELDEIGSVLSLHPGIEFSAAVVDTLDNGVKQLVAYVLPRTGLPLPTADSLQEYLSGRLPDYMVPVNFVRLDALPLSPNGKVDLTNLPRPSAGNLLERTPHKQEPTQIQAKLLKIVQELLDTDSVSVKDNFFLMGGHSLLGMQLVLRLRTVFGVDISLHQLFEAATVESLASLLETTAIELRLSAIWKDLLGQQSIAPTDNFFELGGTTELIGALQQRIASSFGAHIAAVALIRNPILRQQVEFISSIMNDRPLPSGVFASRPGRSAENIFWIHYLFPDLAEAIGDDRSFLSIALMPEDIASLSEAPSLQEIAGCLMRRILATQPEGPYILGGYCVGGVLAYEVASQMQAQGNEVSLLVLLDTPDPSFFRARKTLAPSLSDLDYFIRRAAKLGPKPTISKIRRHLVARLPYPFKNAPVQRQRSPAQEIIEAAAVVNQPRKYFSEVLLLLASEHPSHFNFLPEWQELVPEKLHAEYIDAHHNELTNTKNASIIADLIRSRLTRLGAGSLQSTGNDNQPAHPEATQ